MASGALEVPAAVNRTHPLTGRTSAILDDSGRVRSATSWPIRTGGSTGRVGSFGWTRDGGSSFHRGVDYLADLGRPVYCAHAGRVTVAARVAGFGLCVYLGGPDPERRGPDVLTIYAHLAALLVREGDDLEPGEAVGLVGRSGFDDDSIPAHLHFEVRPNGKKDDATNPEVWLNGPADDRRT